MRSRATRGAEVHEALLVFGLALVCVAAGCSSNDETGTATSPASQLSSGAAYNCAARQDGSVVCWGKNDFGQSSPPPGDNFVEVATAILHSCGLLTDGTVSCWGTDNAGATSPPSDIEYDEDGNRLTPPVIIPIDAFEQITAGPDYTCGIVRTSDPSYPEFDRWAVCWGLEVMRSADEDISQADATIAGTCQGGLNDGEACTTNNRNAVKLVDQCPSSPGSLQAQCIGPPAFMYTQISAGSTHTCGVVTDGSADCWGSDGEGQSTPFATCDAGPTPGASCQRDTECSDIGVCLPDPFPFGPLFCFAVVDGLPVQPPLASCTIPFDGTECSNFGECNGAQPHSYTQVASGLDFSCGLTTDGEVVCWGSDSFRKVSSAPPMGSGPYIQLATGSDHACAIALDGTVECWGSLPEDPDEPVRVPFLDGRTEPLDGVFEQIECGSTHTCGIRPDGTVECWGDNASGESMPPMEF